MGFDRIFLNPCLQLEADPEEGVEIREQVRQAAEEGRRVQLQKPTEAGEEEGVPHGGRREGGSCKSILFILNRNRSSKGSFYLCSLQRKTKEEFQLKKREDKGKEVEAAED